MNPSAYTVPICVACLKTLTPEERRAYECRCEGCEGKWNERIQAWRDGKPDAELDDMFMGPHCLSPLLGRSRI